MNAIELRATLGLAAVYALRMLGMFLVLPVFALYAKGLLHGASPAWIGFALGSYGLTQALLQLPFGMWSDRIGRKKVIYFGLILFAIGSVIAALAPNIEWLTIGRVVQGSGAVSAALTALLADLTSEEHRTHAMAMIGLSIGVTFAVSLVLGPVLANWIGVDGIFALTALFTLIALLAVKYFIPNPIISRFHSDTEANTARLKDVIKNTQLLRLNYGIFVLYGAQMAMFIVIPFALISTAHLDKAQHWQVYLPVSVLGFVLMVPAIIYGEKYQQLKKVFISAIVLMTLAQMGMAYALSSLKMIFVWLSVYFVAFNILEATLPSLISKIAPSAAKGTAIGVYNTAQSLGLFVGASIGGLLYTHWGSTGVFSFTALMMLSWVAWASTMVAPKPVKSMMFSIGQDWYGDADDLSRRLAMLRGVKEAVILLDERVAYLKVSQHDWDEALTKQLIEETHLWHPSTKPS